MHKKFQHKIMGIILICSNCIFHVSYRSWNNFKIIISKACIRYINFETESKEFENYCINVLNNNVLLSQNLSDYLKFFIKNIEILKELNIIGIYHLLINQENKGYFVFSNSKKIFDMIQLLEPFFEENKQDLQNIHNLNALFNKSFQNSKNIYFL